MPRDETTVAEIAEMLAARIPELASQLLPLGRAHGKEWVEASKSKGGLGDSLSVCLTGGKRGIWTHAAASVSGDPLDLIQYIHSLDKGAAVRWAKDWLGIASDGTSRRDLRPAQPQLQSADQARDEADRIEKASTIWSGVVPIDGTLAEMYLSNRGCDLPAAGLRWPGTIGFHPALRCTHFNKDADRWADDGIWPALVAMVEAPNGDFAGVWRIFLDRDGSGKAPVPVAKQGLGVTAGGAVRLMPARGPALAIGEGLETCLAYMELTGGEVPVWAGLSTSGLVGAVLPDHISEPIAIGDRDEPVKMPDGTFRRTLDGRLLRPGIEACRKAFNAWRASGRSPRVDLSPAPFPDFADLLLARKVSHV